MQDMMDSVVMDIRLIPANERHAAALKAFAALPVGQSLELLTDQEPRLLRAAFIAQWADQQDWQVVENGPGQWRSRITRLALRGCCGGCGGARC